MGFDMRQIYATYDHDLSGYNVTGHYDSEEHEAIPAGAVEITDEQWQLSCAGRLRIENGEPVEYVAQGPTFEEVRQAKSTAIDYAYDAAISSLPLDPPKERETYGPQYLEAVQWQKDNSFPTPMIDGILSQRQVVGEDKAVLCARIIAAATMFGQAAGPLTGKRQRLSKAIEAASTLEELELISW